MRARRTVCGGLAALVLSLCAAAGAHGAVTYQLAGTFGSGEIFNPVGIAVDQASGTVYVGSLVFAGVGEFRGSGADIGGHLRTFGAKSFLSGTAVNPVTGNVYVVNAATQEIQTYTPAGELVSEFSVAGSANLFEEFTAVQIATDAAGNVYLPNAPNNEVQEFDPEGKLLATFAGTGPAALNAPTGVAVDAAGNVYVSDSGNGRVEEFSSGGAFVMALGTGVDQTTNGSICTAASGDLCGPGSDGPQALALDGDGDLFVGENGGGGFHVAIYASTGNQLGDFGLGTIGSSEFGTIDTLAVGPGGFVYVADGGNSLIEVYAPQSKPTLRGASTSVVRQSTATLNASIVPNHAATTYHFEYGTTASYGTSIPVPDGAIGDGGLSDETVNVGQELDGLQPATTYHYRVVAGNAVGQTIGPDQTFTTPAPRPPLLSTDQAAEVRQNSATLLGTIDAMGSETTYEFDFGVDTGYGTRIFGDAGAVPEAQTFVAALQGLMPGTTYHYRILATNAFGTTYGADQTFTTASYPTATLAAPTAPPLLSTELLAPAPSVAAHAAAARSTAHAARHAAARHRSGRGWPRRRHRARGVSHHTTRARGK